MKASKWKEISSWALKGTQVFFIFSLIVPDAMCIDSKLFNWNEEILTTWETFYLCLKAEIQALTGMSCIKHLPRTLGTMKHFHLHSFP